MLTRGDINLSILEFFKNIFSTNNSGNLINIYLRDDKCGGKIKVLVRKSYDIQRIYEHNQEAEYSLKKAVICNNCYNKIDVKIDFNKRYNIIDKTIKGGELITEDEYKKN